MTKLTKVYTTAYTNAEVIHMLTGKLFENGGSQAVRLPKEYRFGEDENEVFIMKTDYFVMLLSKNSRLKDIFPVTDTTTVFNNGRSQAVRLPKEYRFDVEDDEISLNKIGDPLLLFPKDSGWDSFVAGVNMFSDDFMADGRGEDVQEEREPL